MLIISRFYGILIKMYFNEHGKPHFHAIYGEYNGVYNLDSLEMTEGDLPSKAQALVKEWACRYRSELLGMWNSREYIKLPGLE